MSLPFSQACENNKAPILEILRRIFGESEHVLEIGSGTAQHAHYFAPLLPHLIWQTSDVEENLADIKRWLNTCEVEQPKPLLLNMLNPVWPDNYDAVFSANTAHIMSWSLTEKMIRHVGENLPEDGKFVLYGPFNYDGAFTSESNERFEQWLKSVSLERGIRDFEKVNACAQNAGMELLEDNAMPANNRTLVWKKLGS